jgi:glycosyltransferase involved in cell wall biosynthesis
MMDKKQTALVMIGRNEAKNLAVSLPAIQGHFNKIIYVDSGSTDGSQELAKSYGADVIGLDTEKPFTAARARNAGLEAILSSDIAFKYIQFIDGDCELIPEYLDKALEFLEKNPDYGMTCGRRVERHPENSIFNALCDIEWNTAVGDTDYCGGDVTVRVAAIREVDGYNADLIAGEDPELCVRMRQAGWKLYRINADMTLHDANITRISQWWQRNKRAGYAFAEGASLHGKTEQRHWVKEARSNWIWGGFFLFVIITGLLIHPALFVLILIYPLQAVRLSLKSIPNLEGQAYSLKLLYGLDCYFAKPAQFIGQLKFLINKLSKRRQQIIEYK